MSDNQYRQAEKELHALRRCAETLKGLAAFEAALQEAGSIQRMIEAKKTALATVEADVAREAQRFIEAKGKNEAECAALIAAAEMEKAAIEERIAEARGELAALQSSIAETTAQHEALLAAVDEVKARVNACTA